MQVERVAEGLQFPEGPIALRDGSVLLVEIQRRTLTRIAPDGTRETVCDLGGGPNGAAIGPDGAVYVANNGGSFSFHDLDGVNIPGPTPPEHAGGSIQRADLSTGKVETLYADCEGERFEGPNDLVFDGAGGFWFTDHGCSTPKGRNYGALYYARADGSKVERVRAGLISPNGVGLSPDGAVVYVADTFLGRLWAFDVAEPGRLAPAPPLQPGRVVCNLPGYQLLDSLAVEAAGKICVGTLINGGVTVFDPDGSSEHLAFPDLLCTNICFGGPDLMDAWITASGGGALFKCRWPRPGLKLAYEA
jgi:gluconolactonase